MADERPPTYQELLDQNAQLKTYTSRLELTVKSLRAMIRLRDIEIGRLATKARKKPQRQLDPNDPSPFNRPYDGR